VLTSEAGEVARHVEQRQLRADESGPAGRRRLGFAGASYPSVLAHTAQLLVSTAPRIHVSEEELVVPNVRQA
jgi:hypothetical protein